MKTMKKMLLLAGFALAIAACSPRVAVDSANVNFSKYHTYDWMDSDVRGSQNPLYYNQIATQNVENVVDQALTNRGVQRSSSRPDLLIGYHFFVQEKTRTVSNGFSGPVYGPYYGWGRWGYSGWGPGWYGNSFGNNQYTQQQYEAGTVVVDMVDSRTHQLVWRGSIQDAVNNPAKINDQLAREVQKIVEKFPAGQRS